MEKSTHKNNDNALIRLLFKWGGIPTSFLLAHLVLYFLEPDSMWWSFYRDTQWFELGLSLLTGIVMYAVIFAVISYTSYQIDRNDRYKDKLLVRFFATTVLVVISMLLLLYAEGKFYDFFYPDEEPEDARMEQAFRHYFVVNVIVAVFVNSFYNIYMFFERWKAEMMKSGELSRLSHELKETTLQAELRALKMQLDPHFLFNNFSILTQLIQTDKEDALLFLGNLSRVYRYVLASAKKDMTTVEDELRFVESYFHLIKIRHGEAVHLHKRISVADKLKGIPPLTLQLLIENAIKHNMATTKRPLSIHIESEENGYISVRNDLQRINIQYPSSGLGLTNITQRYLLLGGVQPEIVMGEDEFVVRLPLLNF